MISQRQKSVLNAIIKEYINCAQPISSKFLEKGHGFDVCPATIRNDMAKLTELNYLSQPHTSAGRVPTDKAYRFFVDSLLEGEMLVFEHVFEMKDIFQEQRKDTLNFVSKLLKFLSETSSSLAIAHLFNRDFVWKEGWEQVLKEPEFEEKQFVHSFAGFLESFENNIKDFEQDCELSVFIGSENPFKIHDFTIISSNCSFPEKEKVTLALLGPKRMDYNRNISLMNSLTKLLEDLD
ncbi:MAG: hypothetical protein ACKKMW_01955 [Candidatus Nealsonbacteria bacterium]